MERKQRTYTASPSRAANSNEAARELDLYGETIRRHGLLDREGERALGIEIEARSIALWTTLLAHPATTALVARAAAERLPEVLPEALPLLALPAPEASARMHALDVDHVLADQVVARVAAASGDAELAGPARAVADAARAVADARARFVQANVGLVMYVARRFRSTTLTPEDLVQEGMFGLIKAVNRYDHRRGLRFSTFATWWIRHHVGRAVADTGRLIRVPVHVQESRQRLVNVRAALRAELGRPPTRVELARAADLTLERLEQLEEAGVFREIRLDAPAGEDQDTPRIEVFADPDGEEVDAGDAIDTQTLTRAARALLPELAPMEREVLRRRFGLGDDAREETFREIASDHGLSRERIRQIEAAALRKLREKLASVVGADAFAQTAA